MHLSKEPLPIDRLFRATKYASSPAVMRLETTARPLPALSITTPQAVTPDITHLGRS